ncbi:MAG: zf-HC2 domain-containing protein [Pirellulales bacterium]
MDHPNQECLIEFLYGELPPARQSEIAQHVEMCDQCRAQLASWGRVRGELQTWRLPQSVPTRQGATSSVSGLWWAVAAVLLVGLGFGLARLGAPVPADPAQMRADMLRQLRAEFRQQLAADFSKFAADQLVQQQDHQRALNEMVRQFESRQLREYVSLRRDVETVALRSQERFDQLAELAPSETSAQPLDR